MTDPKAAFHAWRTHAPGRVIGRGHPAGDFLEAYDWQLLEERVGYLRIEAGLPEQVRQPARTAVRRLHSRLCRHDRVDDGARRQGASAGAHELAGDDQHAD